MDAASRKPQNEMAYASRLLEVAVVITLSLGTESSSKAHADSSGHELGNSGNVDETRRSER